MENHYHVKRVIQNERCRTVLPALQQEDRHPRVHAGRDPREVPEEQGYGKAA